jgi:hypothetical protein
MTHSLHREGSLDSLEKDFVLYIYPAKGINWKGSVPKVRRLAELVYQAGPANLILTTLRRNMYSGITPEEVLESITQEGTRVFCVFNGREKITEALTRIKGAYEGISIVVSGVIDRVREISAEIGIDPHTINLSLGIHGRTDRLPPADIREFTTMCGHGIVSPHLVRDIIRRVKTGKIDEWEGSIVLAKPCACGIFNPYRAMELLREKTPLYTVDRW